jgi:adenylate cyclase
MTNIFSSYLSYRMQSVRVRDLYSTKETVEYGVSQGSVLGPTLFLTYTDQLCRLTISNVEIISFADDTAILFYGNSWEEIRNLARNGLTKLMRRSPVIFLS